MRVGVARIDDLMPGGEGAGNLVMLVGAEHGPRRDWRGDVLASRVFDESSAELRPTVQVGNPVPGEAAHGGLPGDGRAKTPTG